MGLSLEIHAQSFMDFPAASRLHWFSSVNSSATFVVCSEALDFHFYALRRATPSCFCLKLALDFRRCAFFVFTAGLTFQGGINGMDLFRNETNFLTVGYERKVYPSLLLVRCLSS